ncbi:DUF3530 family protein [Alteromonas flava]|uniref:DUF3530 family protein n=1 Tax=Alteromonas flava TaxID=2048003 RepID=UPI000F5DE4AB|nr:DUF3530 family protein [Alteromonas flava]
MLRIVLTILQVLLLSLMLSWLSVHAQALPNAELLHTDTQNRLPQASVETILAGTEQVPVTSTSASLPLTRGVAIIISDHLDGVFGDDGISVIAQSLNEWGWHTVILPAPVPNLSSEEIADAEAMNALSAQVTFTSEARTRYGLSLSQRMQGVAELVQTVPGYRLVIARGIAAAGLISLYQQGALAEPDSLVITGPFWPNQSFNQQLPVELAQTPFPVLDITSEWDNRWSLQTIDARRKAAVTELKLHYRQRDIVGTVYTEQQYLALAKQIYGWITYLGW